VRSTTRSPVFTFVPSATCHAATLPAIADRLSRLGNASWQVTTAPTVTQRQAYQLAANAFEAFLPKLRTLVQQDLKALEETMEHNGAPWTPGRLPSWTK